MRINTFVATAAGLSRRSADRAVAGGQVQINGLTAVLGASVTPSDRVMLDGRLLTLPAQSTTVLLNKPAGYVCSRRGQGSRTVYDLLPAAYHYLKPVGRLDKDSSGLLLLTDDGQLAHRLTHPRFQKEKTYQATLDKPLTLADKSQLERGVMLEDGLSRLRIESSPLSIKALSASTSSYQVRLSEGRNRQIRRSFTALGYIVTKLHRTQFGEYQLQRLESGAFIVL